MLKNILFGRRTKKWKKREIFFEGWVFLVKKGRWRGVKEGHGGTGKGCHWKRKVSATLPYRLSLPKTVHFFTMGDKVLWVLLLEVKGHGSRGITGWFITRARVRAHYMCAMFFWETGLPGGWQGFEGRGMTENPETEERLRLKRAGIMALFIFGIKRAGKKDTLLSKK